MLQNRSKTKFYNEVVYGRGLLEHIENYARPPYLVVTMEDIWPMVKDNIDTDGGQVYFCKTLEYEELLKDAKSFSGIKDIIGIGGGVAADVTKFFSWWNHTPFFLYPTSISVNGWFSPVSSIRKEGLFRVVGWAVPEAVYVDYGLVQSAPLHINRASVGDIFAIHTALYDWKLATDRGKEKKFPLDEDIVAESQGYLQNIIENRMEIRNVTESAIKLVMETHRWSAANYHNLGFSDRFIAASEHFFTYNLEHITGKKFIHGEPVCLGIVLLTAFTDNKHEEMLQNIRDVGVRIHPDEIGVKEEEVVNAFETAKEYSQKNGWPYTVFDDRKVGKGFVKGILKKL